MKSNSIWYLIKEGICSIFTHSFMSFASVCTIIACLVIMGSCSLVAFNVATIIEELQKDNQILAYVDDSYDEEQARELQTEIEALDNVQTATFISKDEAMDSFAAQYDSRLFNGMDSSILRHRFIIQLKDNTKMEKSQKDIMDVYGIVKVNAHVEISRGFVTMRNIVLIVAAVLVAILFIISLFIMTNTIKLATFERREEIAIMKMVGAANSFIRWPFVVEGLMLGAAGALSAYLVQWGIYQVMANQIIASAGLSFLQFMPFATFSIPLLIAFGAVGLGVGIFGSLTAIKNYLKV